jgi:hypothetical protein
MNENIFADFYVNQVEADFLLQVAVIHQADIAISYLKHFCGNCNTHRRSSEISTQYVGGSTT